MMARGWDTIVSKGNKPNNSFIIYLLIDVTTPVLVLRVFTLISRKCGTK